MLHISPHQIDVLQKDMDRRYANEFVVYLRETAPEIAADNSDEELRSRVVAVLPAARSYGIHGDSATAQIATLAAAMGPSILEQEEVKHLLEAPDLPGDAKVEMLCELLSDSSPQ